MAHNDQRSPLLIRRIVIAVVVTGATCNDPNGGCPKVNFFKEALLGKLARSQITPTNYNSRGPWHPDGSDGLQ